MSDWISIPHAYALVAMHRQAFCVETHDNGADTLPRLVIYHGVFEEPETWLIMGYTCVSREGPHDRGRVRSYDVHNILSHDVQPGRTREQAKFKYKWQDGAGP